MKNNEFENNHLAELLYYYRLKKDLEFTEEKIEENKLIEIKEDQNVLVKFWNKNVENFIRGDELKKHNADKESIEKRISDFVNSHEGFDYEEYSNEDKLLEYVDEQVKADKSSLLRINLGLLAVLESNDFVNKEKTKEQVSKILFNSKGRIKELEKSLEKNYLKICGKTSFDEIGKKVLLGIGFATAFATLGTGLLAGSAFFEVLNASFIYSIMVVGASAIVYKLIDIDDKENIKKEFRKMSADDAGAMFALKATLIEEAKKIMDKNEFDEFLDSSLRCASDLRSDTEFMLLIEQKEVDSSKKKIKIFNNWTNRLASIVVNQ
ncbi:MAG: hypothetical protein E7372_01485 [Clostridiales bacterium]|nr:hypothetical protein [Clostridiales bacterium]